MIEREQLKDQDDAWTRARKAGELINMHQEEVIELSRVRREAIDELLSAGNKQTDVARALGMARSRMSKLLTSGPKPARALLGSGSLTVAVGGKQDAQKSTLSAIISAESLQAYEILKDLAASYSLDISHEVVPTPGMIRLNRANLIVMTSPRLLPLVGQVLEADENLAFENGAQGWYIRDVAEGKIYRSPSDTGGSSDFAYIGRLPRPDGKGTFLYLAGIHAMGTLGAARFLADNTEDLYSHVKARRWSTVIECHYDPDSRDISSTGRVSPIYTV